MKLCIKIDDRTGKLWEEKKEELEYAFESIFGKPVTLTKLEVLQGLLVNSFEDASVLFYAELFDEGEVDASISDGKVCLKTNPTANHPQTRCGRNVLCFIGDNSICFREEFSYTIRVS
jgi:hypothetical protein